MSVVCKNMFIHIGCCLWLVLLVGYYFKRDKYLRCYLYNFPDNQLTLYLFTIER